MAVSKGDVFRIARWLHGYLSAFAFLSLMFFSATGLILNHPDWTRALRPQESSAKVQLDAKTVQAAAAQTDPGPALVKAAQGKTPLIGQLKSADIVDDLALVRLEGPKGSTDLSITLKSGETEVITARAPALTLLNELHKGRDSGAAWKGLIDVSAILFLVLSLVGYVLFFSLRFRLRSSLVVTAVSLVLMVGIVWLLTQ